MCLAFSRNVTQLYIHRARLVKLNLCNYRKPTIKVGNITSCSTNQQKAISGPLINLNAKTLHCARILATPPKRGNGKQIHYNKLAQFVKLMQFAGNEVRALCSCELHYGDDMIDAATITNDYDSHDNNLDRCRTRPVTLLLRLFSSFLLAFRLTSNQAIGTARNL